MRRFGCERVEEKAQYPGSVLAGFGMAFLCQVICGLIAGAFLPIEGSGGPDWLVFELSSWGLTQWVGILPLVFIMRRRGNRRTVIGLLLMGAIGLLLSSACASVFWGGRIGG